MPSKTAKSVVFVVFPQVKLLDLTGPMQVFADAQLVSDQHYDVRVVSREGGNIPSDAVLPIATAAISALKDASIDTLIIAGGPGAFAAAEDEKLLQQIRDLAAKSRRTGSVCTGAFVLASTGLLAGRRAVTHWESCERFSATYPDIRVEPDAIFVTDSPFWTSAGVTAGIDMSLAMVAEDAGRTSALALARSLVCYMARPGGQSQFSTSLRLQNQDSGGRFDALHGWMTENLTTILSVEVLAREAGMSPRTFARTYKAQTGLSPAKAVEAMRLDVARRLLEATDLPLARVTQKSGFIDDERLRRAMVRALNIAPGEYRQRFGKAQAR